MKRQRALHAGFGAATRAAAAIETAIVVAFVLVPFLFALIDVGQVALGRARLDEAMQDTITYVSAGNSANSAGITAAAQGAYGTAISVSTGTVCYCVKTTTSTPTAPTTIACGGNCATGEIIEHFMTIAVSMSVSVPLPVAALGLPSPLTITETGMVRTS